MRNNLWTNSPRNPIKTNQDTVYINYFFCFLSYAWTLSHLYSLNRALHFGSSTRTYAIPGEFLRSKYIILGKRWGYELNTNNPHDTYHWCNNCAPQGVRNSHWTGCFNYLPMWYAYTYGDVVTDTAQKVKDKDAICIQSPGCTTIVNKRNPPFRGYMVAGTSWYTPKKKYGVSFFL